LFSVVGEEIRLSNLVCKFYDEFVKSCDTLELTATENTENTEKIQNKQLGGGARFSIEGHSDR
jgi:hypothetical protein